jgi:CheY-like chemotaxis protein
MPLAARLEGVRVLVVDDHWETLELFAAVLTASGADVVTALTATDALHLLASNPVDIVLSDIAMPGLNGYWLLLEILRRADDAQVKRVPVVAVTAFGHEHSRARALAAGFADHLQKPVDPDVLCTTLAKVVGR